MVAMVFADVFEALCYGALNIWTVDGMAAVEMSGDYNAHIWLCCRVERRLRGDCGCGELNRDAKRRVDCVVSCKLCHSVRAIFDSVTLVATFTSLHVENVETPLLVQVSRPWVEGTESEWIAASSAVSSTATVDDKTLQSLPGQKLKYLGVHM
ncbi:hypothetical protein DOTSEDRAFT_177728, partial [Dothistroma septosporum NZE10]